MAIEYRSIIMRLDEVNEKAFKEPSDDYEIIYFDEGYEKEWAIILKNSGEFKDKSLEEVIAFFKMKFYDHYEELKEACFFLKDKNTNQLIGTCMNWFAYQNEKKIPILHWLSVDERESGKGHARVLITHCLKMFKDKRPIYLHTQPYSYKAIKLYSDFGFAICKEETYGSAINECDAALEVLKELMPKAYFDQIKVI